jgi:hypothetical protein
MAMLLRRLKMINVMQMKNLKPNENVKELKNVLLNGSLVRGQVVPSNAVVELDQERLFA